LTTAHVDVNVASLTSLSKDFVECPDSPKSQNPENNYNEFTEVKLAPISR